jgi:toxin ParE1/3/4
VTSRIRFHPAARDELHEAALWYERARPGLGTEFHAEVEAALDRIAARSLPGVRVETPGGKSVAKVFLSRFPYAIYFEALDEQCIIWAIAHGRRRPNYWRGRL